MADLSTQERQKQFISDNVNHLARAAYAGYRDAGPGVLVILPEERDAGAGNLSILQYHYMVGDELIDVLRASGIRPPQMRELEQEITGHVQAYDPSKSIVVTFFHEQATDQQVNLYMVDCPTPPAAAYAAFVN